MTSSRLRRGPLLCYSCGHFVLTAIYGFDGAFMLKFYTEFTTLGAAWFGTAVLLRSLVDTAVDPAIGWLSDRTKLPQGRRRPYFLIGTLPAAVLCYFVLCPPASSANVVMAYLLVTSTLLMVCVSLMGIPHMAFAFEMTNDVDERTRIFGYKNFVENVTTIITLFSVPAAMSFVGTDWLGETLSRDDCYRIAAAGIGVLAVLSAAIAYAGTSESSEMAPPQFGFWQGVAGTLRNPAFRVLLAVMALLIVADRLVISQLFIVLEQFHGKPEDEAGLLLAGFLGGGLLSVWPWVWAAEYWGKRRTLQTTMLIWPLTCLAFVAKPWGDAELVGIATAMGVIGTGMITILGATGPDVLDYAPPSSGVRREGMYVSVANVMFQLATGVGLLLGGVAVEISGYDAGVAKSARVIDRLRFEFALGPVVITIAALIVFRWFPIPRRADGLTSPQSNVPDTGRSN